MSWVPDYILLIVTTTVVVFVSAIGVEKSGTTRGRRLWLGAGLAINLGILFTYKYFNFVGDSIRAVSEFLGIRYDVPYLNLLLPIGISFYSFQAVGYLADVYRGEVKASRHLGKFALFISFFPQLVAGPIERASRLRPQLEKHIRFDYRNVTDGFKLIVWGLFKKVVIADRLSVVVNTVYSDPTAGFSGIHFIVATFFFAIQIYCDFSGYSDIAIGSAQVLGISLSDNFKRPYHASNIQDFWRRWHITLSTWFRDYVYIPLGGNRKGSLRTGINLMITFLLCGLWHGANWTYVTWGGLIGLYLVVYRMTGRLRGQLSGVIGLGSYPRTIKYLSILFTFSLVCFAWIFFRAKNIDDALYIAGHIFSGLGAFVSSLAQGVLQGNGIRDILVPEIHRLGFSVYEFLVAIGSIVFLEVVHLIQRHNGIRHMLIGRPAVLRWTLYYALLASIVVLGKFSYEEFIYFRF